ncbi:hypothetical protein EJB05_37865 [Eragrostis curvula]|uniref:FBD domain-containing protein n=1 Tax=Eragrostis curvula TaxID=38414 RepID=A0A5J9TSN4_9POAL|nr:hypothetical protein EJB05_37865 [Eragrostis curvula]
MMDGQEGRHRVVDGWVRRALDGNPLVLQVRFQDSVYRRYSSLNNLLPSPRRHLKQFEISGVSLDESFAEDLILRRCYNEFSAIHSDKLKNLVVDKCESQHPDVFVVRAPGLSSLCLDLSLTTYKKGISLDVGNSLINASVSMPYGQPRNEAKLIGALFSVTSLELIRFQPTAMLDEEFDKLQIFNNLRTLSLSCFISNDEHYVHTFKPLDRFLRKCPNLEKFTLERFPLGYVEIDLLYSMMPS